MKDKDEMEKCKDPVYFAKHYVRIKNADGTFSELNQAQLDEIAFIEKMKAEGKDLLDLKIRTHGRL